MIIIRLLPVHISALLLAAHFLRASDYGLVLIALSIPFLLLIQRRWVARVIQLFLIVGSYVWFSTVLTIMKARLARGESWGRVVIIMGVVALFTAASAFGFSIRKNLSF